MIIKTKFVPDSRSGGFTLVEIAIVCVIIGVLIVGVLKGQELISNARILATTTAIKTIDAAVTTFKETYNDLPGDIQNPDQRLPNCTTAPCNISGDGNGSLNNPPDNPPVGESNQFFTHLQVAGLFSGIVPEQGRVWGGLFPKAPITGNGIYAGESPLGIINDFSGIVDGAGEVPSEGLYLHIVGETPDTNPPEGAMTPTEAAQIDRKMDDGVPGRGFIRGRSTIATCGNRGADGNYLEDTPSGICSLFIQIQR